MTVIDVHRFDHPEVVESDPIKEQLLTRLRFHVAIIEQNLGSARVNAKHAVRVNRIEAKRIRQYLITHYDPHSLPHEAMCGVRDPRLANTTL